MLIDVFPLWYFGIEYLSGGVLGHLKLFVVSSDTVHGFSQAISRDSIDFRCIGVRDIATLMGLPDNYFMVQNNS